MRSLLRILAIAIGLALSPAAQSELARYEMSLEVTSIHEQVPFPDCLDAPLGLTFGCGGFIGNKYKGTFSFDESRLLVDGTLVNPPPEFEFSLQIGGVNFVAAAGIAKFGLSVEAGRLTGFCWKVSPIPDITFPRAYLLWIESDSDAELCSYPSVGSFDAADLAGDRFPGNLFFGSFAVARISEPPQSALIASALGLLALSIRGRALTRRRKLH